MTWLPFNIGQSQSRRPFGPSYPLEKFIKLFENLVMDGLVQVEAEKRLSSFGSAVQPELQQIGRTSHREKGRFRRRQQD